MTDNRQRPPNRRRSFTLKFKWISPGGGIFTYFGTVGYFENENGFIDPTRPREVFLESAKATSDVSYQVSEAAILASIAFQNGATLDDVMSSLPKLSERAPGDARPATVLGWFLTLVKQGLPLPEELRPGGALAQGYALAKIIDAVPEEALPTEGDGLI